MPVTNSVLGDYLRARRALLKPEDVGYPADTHRRVQGLRREEVAELAGISLEYYVRLEQGRDHQVSEQVLVALARALLLDENGRTYLYRLAFPSPTNSLDPRPAARVSEPVMQLLAQWASTPAYLFDRNLDIVFTNDLARALSPGYVNTGNNLVEMLFTADTAGRMNPLWRSTARSTVAALRFNAEPTDPRLHEIVGALSVRDDDFRRIWADHEAKPLTTGIAPNFVEGFGWVELRWQVLEVPDGFFMNVKLAGAGTPAGEAIAHLSAMLRSENYTTTPEPVRGEPAGERTRALL